MKGLSNCVTDDIKTMQQWWFDDSVGVKLVINKGYFSEAFLFKPRCGRSPPSGLNRKPRKYPLFCL